MSVEETLYPLSTPGGASIPFDLGEPIGLFPIDFTDVDAEATLPDPDDGYDVAVLLSNEDVILRIGGAVTTTNETLLTNAVYVPADVPTAVKISGTAAHVMAPGSGDTGRLWIQYFRKWASLSKDVLQDRM